MRRITTLICCFISLCSAQTLSADTIVQTGMLSGGLGQQTHNVILDQFDTMGGTRQLNFIHLDFLTSVIGGYQTDGSGIPVHIIASLSADYSLNGNLLAQTHALVDTIVPNTSRGSATVFNSDPQQVLIDQPSQMNPWIGTGQITLSALTDFIVSEDPPGIINFGAGGSARYTVTYDYSIVPAAGNLLFTLMPLVARPRRRST